MTNEELIKELIDNLDDELEGICEYNMLYEHLMSMGKHREAERIERIASEEYYHSKILYDILDSMGVDLSHNIKIQTDWAKVKKILAIE